MPDRSAPLSQLSDSGKAILEAASEILKTKSPSDLRVSDVADRAGVAVGLLYHYFDDRDDLVDAVREAQFLARIEADIEMLSGLVGSAEMNTAAVLGVIVDDMSDPRNKKRRDFRLDRMEALVAARHNPELTKRLTAAQRRLSKSIQQTIEKAKTDGLVAPDVDTKALAFFLEVVPLGTALSNVYADLPARDEWNALLYRMLMSLMPQK